MRKRGSLRRLNWVYRTERGVRRIQSLPELQGHRETFRGVSAGMSQRCSGGRGSPKSSSIRALSPHGLQARIHVLKQNLLLNRNKSHLCSSAEVALTTFISDNPDCWGSTFPAWREEIPNNWYRRWGEVGGVTTETSLLDGEGRSAHWGQPGPRREVSSRRLEGPCHVGFSSTVGTSESFDMKK